MFFQDLHVRAGFRPVTRTSVLGNEKEVDFNDLQSQQLILWQSLLILNLQIYGTSLEVLHYATSLV